jgi:hypothetical protein
VSVGSLRCFPPREKRLAGELQARGQVRRDPAQRRIMRSSGRGGDQEEYQSLIGRRAQSASRILLVEARYVAIVTGVLLGLYSGQHLVSGRAAHVTIAAAPPQEEPPERTPQEEPPAPTKKPAVERRPRAVVRWPEVRERVFARQVQIEQDGKKSKKILHYAGPRVSGYLYVGPGHVRRDLRGAKQPGNVTEAQCSRVCSDNPACKGFAWCARARAATAAASPRRPASHDPAPRRRPLRGLAGSESRAGAPCPSAT